MAIRAKNKNIFERYLYSHWPIHYLLMNEDSDERSRALFVSSPEPKAHGGAYCIPVTLASVRCPSSVRPQFQTSSLKRLGQLNSNFILRLLRTQERSLFKWSWSHDQDGRHPQWPHIWKKPFKNLLHQNQKADDLGTWYVAFGLWGLLNLCK